jgi:hypothetical protein
VTRDPNRERLIRVAERLGELLPKVAFVGGSVTGLLVPNIDIRPTDDVDLIAPGESPTDYELDVARPLRELGWREDASDRAPRCRWVHPDAGLADVMTPVDAGFGFSNRWYPPRAGHRDVVPSALTKMDHVVLTRVDPGSMTKITRGAAALAA